MRGACVCSNSSPITRGVSLVQVRRQSPLHVANLSKEANAKLEIKSTQNRSADYKSCMSFMRIYMSVGSDVRGFGIVH